MHDVTKAEQVMEQLKMALLQHTTQTDAAFNAQDVEGFFSRQKSGLLQLIEQALKTKRSRGITIPDAFVWQRADAARAAQGYYGPTSWGGFGGRLVAAQAERATLMRGTRIIDRHGRHGAVQSVRTWNFHTVGGSRKETEVTFLPDSSNREADVNAKEPLYEEVERPTKLVMDPYVVTETGTTEMESPHLLYIDMWRQISFHLKLYRLARWIEYAEGRHLAPHNILAECKRKMTDSNPARALNLWTSWEKYFLENPHLQMADVSTFDPFEYRIMSLHMSSMQGGALTHDEQAEYQYILEQSATPRPKLVEVGDAVTVLCFRDGAPLNGTVTDHQGIAYQVQLENHEYHVPVSGLKLAGVPPAPTATVTYPMSVEELMRSLLDWTENSVLGIRADVTAVLVGVTVQEYLDAYASKPCRVSVTKNTTTQGRGRRATTSTAYAINIFCDDVKGVIGELCQTQYLTAVSAKQLVFDPSSPQAANAWVLNREQAQQFSPLLARQMYRTGRALNRIGQLWLNVALPPAREQMSPTPQLEMQQGTSEYDQKSGGADCMEITFVSPNHGTVRVVCGALGRRDTWHNVWVGNARYGWNGQRWARDLKPPADVLGELLARGISAFHQ